MAKIKVLHDRKGNTLTVWFGESRKEYLCEETSEEVVLMKDKAGRVLGFEKLNFHLPKSTRLQVDFSTLAEPR